MKETSKLHFNDLFSMIDNTSSKSKSEINKKRLDEIDAPTSILSLSENNLFFDEVWIKE